MKADSEERTFLEYAVAVALLPDGETIHTFVSPRAGMLIGASWKRDLILSAIEKHGACLSGSIIAGMGHGLEFWDGDRTVFVETKKVEG